MGNVKLSDNTIVNMAQVKYCKITRRPADNQLVPNASIEVYFGSEQDPVIFEGEEAERLWQAMEYHCEDRPDLSIDSD